MKIIKSVKDWFFGKQLISNELEKKQETTKTVIEDPRVSRAHRKINRAFAMQQEQIMHRALKAHHVSCDVFKCDNKKCMTREPDTFKVVIVTPEESAQELKKRPFQVRPLKIKKSYTQDQEK